MGVACGTCGEKINAYWSLVVKSEDADHVKD